jgi:hypothetical protein
MTVNIHTTPNTPVNLLITGCDGGTYLNANPDPGSTDGKGNMYFSFTETFGGHIGQGKVLAFSQSSSGSANPPCA